MLIKKLLIFIFEVDSVRIFGKALNRKKKKVKEIDNIVLKLLAGIGGFCDAIGGGGWGPIVTTTLVSNGQNPRYTIGSVNAAEFFVTVAQVVVFLLMIELMNWQVIIGLIIGGCIAAPFAAKICKRIPVKIMMIIVGSVIIALQVRTLIIYFL